MQERGKASCAVLCSGTHVYSSLFLPDSDDTGYDDEKVSRWYMGSTCSRFRDVFVGSRALFPPCQPNLPPGVPTWGEFPFTVCQPTTLHAYLGKVSFWTSTFRQPHSHLITNHALNILLRSSNHVTQSNVSNSLSRLKRKKEKQKGPSYKCTITYFGNYLYLYSIDTHYGSLLKWL